MAKGLVAADEHYIGASPIQSPRSLEACRRLGVTVEEMMMQPLAMFSVGVPKWIAGMRWRHREDQRCELVDLVRRERLRLIATSASPRDREDSESSSMTSSCAFTSIEESDDGGLRSQQRFVDPNAATSASLPRSPSMRLFTPPRDGAQHQGSCDRNATTGAGEMMRTAQSSVARQQTPCTVAERVRQVRERWQQQEASLRQLLERRVAAKHRRAQLSKGTVDEHRLMRRLDLSQAHSLRSEETRQRQVMVLTEKQLKVSDTVAEDEAKTLQVLERKMNRMQEEMDVRRAKFDAAMQRARAIQHERKSMNAARAAALAESLERRQAAVDAARTRVVQTKQMEHQEKQNHTARCLHQKACTHQQRAASQQAQEQRREDRLATVALERAMILEQRRMDEEDRRCRALRARRALEYERARKHRATSTL